MRQPWGLVLAGGSGRRMGRTKGDLVLDGVTLAERAARTLDPLVAELRVSVAPGAEGPAAGRVCVEDGPPAGRGPLAGIAAGFRAAGSADLLVLACDYPEVTTALFRRLLARGFGDEDVVVPVDAAGRDHPLVALWRRSAAPAVSRALDDGSLRVGALLAGARVRRLLGADLPGIDLERALRNVNRPGDLR